MSKLVGINSLRFFAIAFIVTYHLFREFLPGGFLAVEIFFCLSGFLVTGKLIREIKTSHKIHYDTFLRSRFERLFPTLLACVLFSLVLGILVNPDVFTGARNNTLTALTFSTNISELINGGSYENTYTLELRGVHDYPMEGANTTQERVRLMQQAINDQRDMLRRNINKPIEEIPQVLCTYEEVLDAYHNGLQVPDDVTLLWSDDKHGYCRNLSNPREQQRKGGAGIYYHLSYHGDPASWIWLSPLSPSFIATELTKAYTFGAKKIWVFNVGDIKPA
jgi:hypothetical protein